MGALKMTAESNSCLEKNIYPNGLLDWAGHRRGGVRKPFRPDTGRPLGRQLLTPLIVRLNNWVEQLCKTNFGPESPRALLLVGGPGNGKTDAIEGCISKFDSCLNANEALTKEFATGFDSSGDLLPPRKVRVNISKYKVGKTSDVNIGIQLIQDATEKNLDSPDTSPEQTLLNELADILHGKMTDLYICCVNRGILANAATLAHQNDDPLISEFLDRIVIAATSGPHSVKCWPLDGFHQISLWPMDLESLVVPNHKINEKSVAHQIFESAVSPENWGDTCSAGPRCPFCQNQKSLNRPGAIDNLVTILHNFELISGKRWTFRDLYSLVPHIIVGDPSAFEVNGKKLSPCEWSKYQLELSDSPPNEDISSTKALYLLVSRLYHHKLFPLWPQLNTGEHRKAKQNILPKTASSFVESELNEGFHFARNHYRHLATYRTDTASSISQIIAYQFSPVLDPAMVSGTTQMFFKDKLPISAKTIDERFSLSVDDGLKFVDSQIAPLERDLLKNLARADIALSETFHKKIYSKDARLLQTSMRQFASRLVKRCIGVRKGACKDSELFKRYAELSTHKASAKHIRKQLSRLLQDQSGFRAGLATTFGQPIAQREKNITLVTKKIGVKSISSPADEGKPQEPLPFFSVNGIDIPMTFQLFKSLSSVDDGLQEASLPEEVFALLDSVKSKVSGRVVRDNQFLEDEITIEIGPDALSIEIEDGIIQIEKVS